MDNLILGFKSIALSLIATLTALSHTGVAPSPSPTPEPSPDKNTIIRSGEYSYSNYTLKYTLRIPKNGGDISGYFSGVCTGPITGKYEGGEGGKVEGRAEANCKIVILKYDLKATYSAKLYLKEGKADINWEGEIPYTPNKGSFTANFEPAN